jgi:kumamolisin
LSTDRVAIEGSRPRSTVGTQSCGLAPPTQSVQATVIVRRRVAPEWQSRLDAIMRGEALPLSRDEVEQSLDTDPEDLRKIEEFVHAHGLTVTESNAQQRSVRISGTVAQMEDAFGVKLRLCRNGVQSYLYYDETLTVPHSLAGTVEGVLGLDQRPIARPREVE